MSGNQKKSDEQISRQNISYYNGIAAGYDAILNKDANNSIVRAKVAAAFTSLVKGGNVLDFGGGTGRDVDWLMKQKYRIHFCEPSVSMRQIAIDRVNTEYPGGSIIFIDEKKTDFRSWNGVYPLGRKMDAVLANFAVINCIPDIGLLFEKLALILEPGGILIALVLDYGLLKRFRSNLRGTVHSLLSGNPVSFFIEHNGERQMVYIHSTNAIQKAAANNFEISHTESMHGFGFRLIHLVRK